MNLKEKRLCLQYPEIIGIIFLFSQVSDLD